MKKLPTILAALGSIVLLATAAFHATGYGFVAREITSSSVAPFVKSAVPTLWLFLSWHLVAVALAVLAGLLAAQPTTRGVLLGCSLVTLIDFGWVFSIAGFFAGSALLLFAALCLLAGGALLPRGHAKAAPPSPGDPQHSRAVA